MPVANIGDYLDNQSKIDHIRLAPDFFRDFIVPPSLCSPGCPLCSGSGWVRLDVPVSDPRFGKLQHCPNLDVTRLPEFKRFGVSADELNNLSLASLYDIGETKSAAGQVVQILERGWGWIYLHGGHGLAKTTILKIAVVASLKLRKPAAYTNMVDVLDHLRSAYDATSPNNELLNRLSWWTELPVLAIDEFNRIKVSDWTSERIFKLMDTRYVSSIRRQNITLIASNLPPESLDSYLADRVMDGRNLIIYLQGESARPGMTTERY